MRILLLASLLMAGCAGQVDLVDVTADYAAEMDIVRAATETRGFAVAATLAETVILQGDVSDFCQGAEACHDPETHTIYIPASMRAVNIRNTNESRVPGMQEVVIHEMVHAALQPMPTADHPESFQLVMELAMLEVR